MSGLRARSLLASIPHRVDKCGKGWGRLAPVRVVQVETLEIRTPVGQYFLEASVSQVGRGERFGNVGQSDSVQCAVEHVDDTVEDELAFPLDGKCLAILFEFPGVDCPRRSVPDVDACVTD